MPNTQISNKFQGNINAEITMASIFSTLSNNQQHGWLFLRCLDYETGLYFKGDIVALVYSPENKYHTICDKLYNANKISLQDWEKIKSSKDYWTTLHEIVDENLLKNIKKQICYEEICKLFTYSNCYFEFVNINDPGANHDLYPVSDFFEVEGILLEVNQQQIEYNQITQILPNSDEILVWQKEPEVMPEADEPIRNVWLLVNGHSIEEILPLAYYGEYDTKRIIASLVANQNIRILKDDELRIYINEYKETQNWQEAVRYGELLVKRNPQNSGDVILLEEAYKQLEQTQKIEVLYYRLAQQFLSSSKPEEQILGASYLKKFCDAAVAVESNEILDARFHLFNMVLQGQIDGKAIDYNLLTEGKKLLQLLNNRKNNQESRQILESLLALHPHDKYLHSQYINVCLDLKDVATAVSEYETMAKIYERDKNWPELISTYQKIIRLVPNRKDIQKKLDTTQSKLKIGRSIFARALLILLILGLPIIGWFAYQEYSTPSDDGVNLNPNPNPNPNSNSNPNITNLPTNVTIDNERERKIDEECKNKLQIAEQRMNENQLYDARKILEEIVAKNPSKETLEKTNIVKEQLDELIQKYEEIYRIFQQRMEEAKNLEKKGSFNEAISIYLGVWKNTKFKTLPEHTNLRLPISLSITPKGASIIIDQNSPIILKRDEVIRVMPDFKTLTIQLNGYQTISYSNGFNESIQITSDDGTKLESLNDAKVKISLQKSLLWQSDFAQSGNILTNSTPCYVSDKDSLYIPTNKYLYIFSNFNATTPPNDYPEFLIPQKLKNLSSFTATPCYANGILYLLEDSQRLYAWNTVTKEFIGNLELGGDITITGIPVISQENSSILFSTSDKKIYCLPLAFGGVWRTSPRWVSITPRKIENEIVITGQKVLVSHTEGQLQCLDINTGRQIWQYTCPSFLHSSPGVAGNIIYLAANGLFIQLDLERGTEIKKLKILGECNSSVVVKNNVAYFTTSSKLLYAISVSGNPRILWKFNSELLLKSGPVVTDNGIVYIGTQSISVVQDSKTFRMGTLYAIDAKDGSRLWSYKVVGDVSSSVVICRDLVLLSANKLYAFLNN